MSENDVQITDRQVEDVLKAISEIPLPAVEHLPHRGRRAPKAGEKQGYTNRGSLQAFDEELSGQARDDALHWTLFGQLAADAQYDRQTQVEDWYKHYIRTLGQIGMGAGAFNWASVSGSQLKASVDLTVLDIIRALVTSDQFALIQSVIEALGSGKANEPLTLFNNRASNANDGNFQVSTGQTDRYANLTIQIQYFYFNTTQNITNMLFWRWTNTNVAFTRGHSELTLSKTLADRTREALLTRLGDRIIENIEDIPLA